MPHGNPKKVISVRLDRELDQEVRMLTNNLTAAIEDGLRLWLKQRRASAARKKADANGARIGATM